MGEAAEVEPCAFDPDSAVEYAKENAKKGQPEDVLRAIDEYCWTVRSLMNVGDVRGLILDRVFQECNPTIAVELGSFIGYSAVRMSRLLKPGGKLYAIDFNSHHAELVREIVDYAGVGEKVIILNEMAETAIPQLKEKHGVERVDFVFLDHAEDVYKPDLIRLIDEGLLQKGSVVLADNVIKFDLTDYLDFVRNHAKFSSELFESEAEYNHEEKDGLEKSVFLG